MATALAASASTISNMRMYPAEMVGRSPPSIIMLWNDAIAGLCMPCSIAGGAQTLQRIVSCAVRQAARVMRKAGPTSAGSFCIESMARYRLARQLHTPAFAPVVSEEWYGTRSATDQAIPRAVLAWS